MTIVIDKDGNVRMLATDGSESLIKALGPGGSKSRASHIEPCDIVLRVFFRSLRILFGETGRIAEWTRGWKIDWRVDLTPSNGPIVEAFDRRSDAIKFEVDWLEKTHYGRR